ncbi:MAG: copper amine oxidase N-terminal domain-containing protein [Candidatus Metalachnospira sp.]|nr:copper amine oxidase N-terminal domain-containing protein [Candidatus Metalachnospira sp.]
MKRKLALLMAAIMTATMVPMTAFASTKLTAVDEVSTAVDSIFESRVELVKSNDQVDVSVSPTFDVTLKLTNGTFAYVDDDSDNDYVMEGYSDEDNGIYNVDVLNDTTATVTLITAAFNQDEDAWTEYHTTQDGEGNDVVDDVALPEACVLTISAKATADGDVVAKFTSNVSAFKSASEVIATAYDGEADIATEGVKTFVEDTDDSKTIKDITINELVTGVLAGNDITLKLKGNYEYECDADDISVSFLNQDIDTTVDVDDDVITISFTDGVPDSNMLKEMTVSGIILSATNDCDAGDVATITVASKDFDSVKLEVAKMVEEAVTYSVDDDDLPVIYSGASNDEINTLEVSIEENTGDILNTSRKATFTFPEGIEVVDVNDINGVSIDGADDCTVEIDENVVSIWDYADGGESDTTDMTISFILNAAPTFTGDVDVTLGGQFDDTSFTVATVKAPYTVAADTSEVLIDYRYVPVNDIVITEAEDGILDDGDQIILAVEKMEFEDAGDIEVTQGDIDVDVDIDENDDSDYAYLVITVNDASTEASTMTISGLELYLDRTLPVGGYALENVSYEDDDNEGYTTPINTLWENSATDDDYYDLSGIFEYDEVIANDSYVEVITSARDSDDSTTTKQIVITVGAATMTAGTDTITLDAPAYINAENYTMLPLRAIAEAFNATVNWDDATKTVTILSGQRIISMTIGSKTMYINGTPVAMNTAPEITSSRTFVPVRDLANSLGISNINWTEASGTVTLN